MNQGQVKSLNAVGVSVMTTQGSGQSCGPGGGGGGGENEEGCVQGRGRTRSVVTSVVTDRAWTCDSYLIANRK